MIELLGAADEEFLAAAQWYEDQQEGLGLRFISEVEFASERIEEHPQIGPLWLHGKVPDGVRRLRLRTFPYHLIYVLDPRMVVVAVAHMKRAPGYWIPRLGHL